MLWEGWGKPLTPSALMADWPSLAPIEKHPGRGRDDPGAFHCRYVGGTHCDGLGQALERTGKKAGGMDANTTLGDVFRSTFLPIERSRGRGGYARIGQVAVSRTQKLVSCSISLR